jgi:hypothetical protein
MMISNQQLYSSTLKSPVSRKAASEYSLILAHTCDAPAHADAEASIKQ